MKVVIVCVWWRMFTAESMERKLKTREDCGRIRGGHIEVPCPLLDTLSDAASGGWIRERSLLFCWLRKNRKQRCVIMLALKMSLIERRCSTLKRSWGERCRLLKIWVGRGECNTCWELVCEAPWNKARFWKAVLSSGHAYIHCFHPPQKKTKKKKPLRQYLKATSFKNLYLMVIWMWENVMC